MFCFSQFDPLTFNFTLKSVWNEIRKISNVELIIDVFDILSFCQFNEQTSDKDKVNFNLISFDISPESRMHSKLKLKIEFTFHSSVQIFSSHLYSQSISIRRSACHLKFPENYLLFSLKLIPIFVQSVELRTAHVFGGAFNRMPFRVDYCAFDKPVRSA